MTAEPARPRITTPMVALAWSIENSEDGAPECGRILARMILEAGENGGNEGAGRVAASDAGGRVIDVAPGVNVGHDELQAEEIR
ncbi:MAG: hypothetical protein ACLP50_32225 [Solirubrobacteraceae bacterium]